MAPSRMSFLYLVSFFLGMLRILQKHVVQAWMPQTSHFRCSPSVSGPGNWPSFVEFNCPCLDA